MKMAARLEAAPTVIAPDFAEDKGIHREK